MSDGTEILDARQYFEELQRVVVLLPHSTIDQIADELVKAYESGRTVYLFGNGGKRFRVLALTDNLPTLTAWANDSSYEDVFSEQLRNFVQPGEVALAISGSGNSKNVLNALRVAREAGATTVGISGFQGGEMKSLCDICVTVPSNNMHIIEYLHLAMAHSIFRIVYGRISRRTMTASSAS